jgi:hypothetical protein
VLFYFILETHMTFSYSYSLLVSISKKKIPSSSNKLIKKLNLIVFQYLFWNEKVNLLREENVLIFFLCVCVCGLASLTNSLLGIYFSKKKRKTSISIEAYYEKKRRIYKHIIFIVIFFVTKSINFFLSASNKRVNIYPRVR